MPNVAGIVAARAAQQAGNALSLPPIPDGHVRLTHVMPQRSRDILSSGEPFLYRKHGLDGTTDSYSDNAAIEHLARTGDPYFFDGKPSNFTRNPFGNHMALIDLPADAHKQIATTYGFDDPIPNAAIVGFVDRDAMAFQPNPRYDRAAIDEYSKRAADRIRALVQERRVRPPMSVPKRSAQAPDVPTLTDTPNIDVW